MAGPNKDDEKNRALNLDLLLSSPNHGVPLTLITISAWILHYTIYGYYENNLCHIN